MAWYDTVGNFLNDNSGAIGQALGTASQLYGQQNAGQAISKAATSGINTANTTMGNINSIWQPQRTLGTQADTALSSSLGIGGKPANYSDFMNMPGYQFAIQQGQQAAERQAAAMGNAGNSGTAAMIGNQVAGTAMQDYNTYINQLYQAAGLGNQANTALTDANLHTAGNIEQLGMNSGMAQAGMYTGMGQTGAGLGGVYGTGYSGPNSSGVGKAGGGNNLVNLIGGGVKAIGNLFSGGGGSSSGPSNNYGYVDTGGGGTYNMTGGYDASGNPVDTGGGGVDTSGGVPDWFGGSDPGW